MIMMSDGKRLGGWKQPPKRPPKPPLLQGAASYDVVNSGIKREQVIVVTNQLLKKWKLSTHPYKGPAKPLRLQRCLEPQDKSHGLGNNTGRGFTKVPASIVTRRQGFTKVLLAREKNQRP